VTIGDNEKGEQLLRQAIDADPARLQGYIFLGQLYASQRRLDDAAQQYQAILKRDQKSVQANTMLGLLLEAQGRTAEAEKQYQQTLALDPQRRRRQQPCVSYVASNRNLDQASSPSDGEKAPDEPRISDTIGWVYLKKYDRAAIAQLESAVKGLPNEPAVHFHLGMAYMAGRLGQSEGCAVRALLKATRRRRRGTQDAESDRRVMFTMRRRCLRAGDAGRPDGRVVCAALAQTGDNVLVTNTASPPMEIADYAQKRHVPADQVLQITVPLTEEIS
jgi:tetratricopeptide (TPR) repeat protein